MVRATRYEGKFTVEGRNQRRSKYGAKREKK